MTTLTIEILEDRTDTGGFGVEGYEIKITSSFGALDAFINMKNIVSTRSGKWLHGLLSDAPHTSESVKNDLERIQQAFKKWNPEIKQLEVK